MGFGLEIMPNGLTSLKRESKLHLQVTELDLSVSHLLPIYLTHSDLSSFPTYQSPLLPCSESFFFHLLTSLQRSGHGRIHTTYERLQPLKLTSLTSPLPSILKEIPT